MQQLRWVSFILLSMTAVLAACSKSGGNNNGNTPPQEAKIPKVVNGSGNTFLLKSDGSLWATGNNIYGELGDGTSTRKLTWEQVGNGVADIDVSQDGFRSCMLKKDGSLWASGQNSASQFGNGTTTYSSTWVNVAGDVAGMCAGYRASFLIKKDGTLWTAGSNYYGDAGLPGYDPTVPPYNSMVSTWTLTASNAASVTAQANSLFLKKDGTLWATGPDIPAQPGASASVNSRSWVQVADNVASMSSGKTQNLMVKKDGTVWAQGSGNFGAFGAGLTTISSHPWVQVADNAAAVSAGEDYSLLLKKDGTVWSTGYNYSGQLGTGSTANVYTWTKVADSAAYISAGASTSFIVKKDGSLWGAGEFDKGQFGDTSIHINPGYSTYFVPIKMP